MTIPSDAPPKTHGAQPVASVPPSTDVDDGDDGPLANQSLKRLGARARELDKATKLDPSMIDRIIAAYFDVGEVYAAGIAKCEAEGKLQETWIKEEALGRSADHIRHVALCWRNKSYYLNEGQKFLAEANDPAWFHGIPDSGYPRVNAICHRTRQWLAHKPPPDPVAKAEQAEKAKKTRKDEKEATQQRAAKRDTYFERLYESHGKLADALVVKLGPHDDGGSVMRNARAVAAEWPYVMGDPGAIATLLSSKPPRDFATLQADRRAADNQRATAPVIDDNRSVGDAAAAAPPEPPAPTPEPPTPPDALDAAETKFMKACAHDPKFHKRAGQLFLMFRGSLDRVVARLAEEGLVLAPPPDAPDDDDPKPPTPTLPPTPAPPAPPAMTVTAAMPLTNVASGSRSLDATKAGPVRHGRPARKAAAPAQTPQAAARKLPSAQQRALDQLPMKEWDWPASRVIRARLRQAGLIVKRRGVYYRADSVPAPQARQPKEALSDHQRPPSDAIPHPPPPPPPDAPVADAPPDAPAAAASANNDGEDGDYDPWKETEAQWDAKMLVKFAEKNGRPPTDEEIEYNKDIRRLREGRFADEPRETSEQNALGWCPVYHERWFHEVDAELSDRMFARGVIRYGISRGHKFVVRKDDEMPPPPPSPEPPTQAPPPGPAAKRGRGRPRKVTAAAPAPAATTNTTQQQSAELLENDDLPGMIFDTDDQTVRFDDADERWAVKAKYWKGCGLFFAHRNYMFAIDKNNIVVTLQDYVRKWDTNNDKIDAKITKIFTEILPQMVEANKA